MPRPSQQALKGFLATAHVLADEAGRVIRPYFRKIIDIENKAAKGFDPVTAADKAAERVIRKKLAEVHPDHGILGEEYGHSKGEAPFTWVIDPIDGTKAFITGTPLWGTLIGLHHEGLAVVGVMDQPFTGERVSAVAGGPSQWRHPDGKVRKLRTRACPKLEDAMLATTSPDLLSPAELRTFTALKAHARLTRYGGDCYAYCLLAAGHFDLILECGLKPHDVAALIPIIEQAGGRITTWDGGAAEAGGRIVAAGDPRLHDAVLEHIARSFDKRGR